jgi:hypothetical protein
MSDEDNGQSGYYRTIAREFLRRRGAPLLLSPRDQAVIAAWEAKRVPLDVALEGIGRAFDGLRARGRPARDVSLAYCDRQVEAALAQHKDRAAGRRGAAGVRPDKRGRALKEVAQARRGLGGEDEEMARLLDAALAVLAVDRPDEATLDRVDAEVEKVLWDRASEAEKRQAESEVRRDLRGRKPAGLEAAVRRKVVQAARAGRKIPHVSLFYY